MLFDTDYPPPENQDYATLARVHEKEVEFQVAKALRARGHDVRLVGFRDDLPALLQDLRRTPCDVVFNLVERFASDSTMDAAVTGLLEMLGLPYTGSPPAALALARDKAKTKHVLAGCGIPVPRFFHVAKGAGVSRCPLRFPVIVKPLDEDASVGISQSAIVNTVIGVARRVAWVHDRIGTDAIVEEFISGRELYVGVLGDPPVPLPPREMLFPAETPERARIATFRAKWDWDYRKRQGIRNRKALKMDPEVRERLSETALRSFMALGLRDYGRVDVRLSPQGVPHVIEVNPNPYLAWGEDMSESAEATGLPYAAFLETLLRLAWRRRAASGRRAV